VNILLVEDDVAYRTAITKVFESQGWTVVGVDRADAALAAIAKQKFDAAVCDFILPASDGSTLFGKIQEAAPELADRLLFVTGWAGDTKARKLLEHTGRPVMEKPVDLADLIAAVKKLGT